MRLQFPLAGGNGAQEKRRRVAVQIEVDKSASGFDVLQTEVFEQ